MRIRSTRTRSRLRLSLPHLGLAALIGSTLVLMSTGGAWADELVVDNADPSVEVTGAWASSRATPGFFGPDYLFHMPGNGSATVVWPFPASAPPGRYQVFARWSPGSNRADQAVYRILAAAGLTVVRANQHGQGSSWQPLGAYEFRAGRGEGVTLSDAADGIVVADAVRFVGPTSGGVVTGAGLADTALARRLQEAVDAGHEPWRLDPLAVARASAGTLEFTDGDAFDLVSQGPSQAVVRANHAAEAYQLRLIQPARGGPSGIWMLESIARLTSG